MSLDSFVTILSVALLETHWELLGRNVWKTLGIADNGILSSHKSKQRKLLKMP